jgi:hypothetical protein
MLGVWTYLQIDWNIGNGDIQSIVGAARHNFRKPFSMEVILTACWHIWLIRNGKILGRRYLALQDGGATSCMPLLYMPIGIGLLPFILFLFCTSVVSLLLSSLHMTLF